MPNKCCVYGCNSNYDSTKERYSTFKFPRDDNLRAKWIRKIPNKDLKVTQYSYVCEKHFTDDAISRYHIVGNLKVSDLIIYTFIIITIIIIMFAICCCYSCILTEFTTILYSV